MCSSLCKKIKEQQDAEIFNAREQTIELSLIAKKDSLVESLRQQIIKYKSDAKKWKGKYQYLKDKQHSSRRNSPSYRKESPKHNEKPSLEERITKVEEILCDQLIEARRNSLSPPGSPKGRNDNITPKRKKSPPVFIHEAVEDTDIAYLSKMLKRDFDPRDRFWRYDRWLKFNHSADCDTRRRPGRRGR